MCDVVADKIALTSLPALARATNDETSALTSLGAVNIVDDGGFGASSVKMSKNGCVIAVGSRDVHANDATQTTNRPGLHIYLKRQGSSGVGSACDGGASANDQWQHYQTILFDTAGQLLQITKLAISDDGLSIVALGTNKIWVFEELNRCSANARWSLQQTISESDNTFAWQTMALDERHKRLVLRKFRRATVSTEVDTTVFCIYDRERVVQKCTNSAQSPNGYRFLPRTQTFTFSQIGDCLTYLYALSHDGQTLIFLVCINEVFHVEQWQFDCQTHVYVLASSFPLAAQSKPFADDVKFGGAHSEKLFILTHQSNNDATVEIHSRLAKTSCGKGCGKVLQTFGTETLVTVLTNISATPSQAYLPSLIADPVDGDSFLLAQTRSCASNQPVPWEKQIFLRLWRQKCGNPAAWGQVMLIDGGLAPHLRCYQAQDFDALSFDVQCNRYYATVNERNVSIAVGTFADVFVNHPDEFFYLVATSNASNEQLYYRVAGQAKYVKFDKSLTRQMIVFSEKTCGAKTLELALTDETSGPVDPNTAPQAILQTASIPIRTCFGVVGFYKS